MIYSQIRLFRARSLIFLLPALLIFIVGNLRHMKVPGIYMDAINPDYLVVKLLNPNAEFYAWGLPGTLLFGKFPTIIQIYHGALPYYIGLPIYALFGTGLFGIRLCNICFGCLVIVGAGAFLRSFNVGAMISAACLAALALDPGFIFSFRTQFYITLLPSALMLTSIALVEYRKEAPSLRILGLAGLLAGLSVYGYFIYTFPSLIALLHLALRLRGRGNKGRLLSAWIAGYAIGLSLYFLGFVLMFLDLGGLAPFTTFFRQQIIDVGPTNSTMSVMAKIIYAKDMILFTLQDIGPATMMLHETPALLLPNTKSFILLGLPVAGWAFAMAQGRQIVSSSIVILLFCAFCLTFFIFGSRMWLHHAIPMLPIFYIGSAVGFSSILGAMSSGRTFGRRHVRTILRAAGSVIVIAPLIFGNFIDRQTLLLELERTGGVGLASNAIVHFAEDHICDANPTKAFFPDWGVFMSFEMITRGRIALDTQFTPEQAKTVLCGGRDVLLGILQPVDEAKLTSLTEAVGWGPPQVKIYAQADGVPVLTSLQWNASSSAHGACE